MYISFIPISTYFDSSRTTFFNVFRSPLFPQLSLQKVGSKSPLFTRKKILFIITPGIFYSYGLCRISRSSHVKRKKKGLRPIFFLKTPKTPRKNKLIPSPHYSRGVTNYRKEISKSSWTPLHPLICRYRLAHQIWWTFRVENRIPK